MTDILNDEIRMTNGWAKAHVGLGVRGVGGDHGGGESSQHQSRVRDRHPIPQWRDRPPEKIQCPKTKQQLAVLEGASRTGKVLQRQGRMDILSLLQVVGYQGPSGFVRLCHTK